MVEPGHLERVVHTGVDELGDLNGMQRALAETAFTLARSLDVGAGMATAAVSRELRATLQALMEACDASGSEAELIARMSSPVGDAPESGSGDARPARS